MNIYRNSYPGRVRKNHERDPSAARLRDIFNEPPRDAVFISADRDESENGKRKEKTCDSNGWYPRAPAPSCLPGSQCPHFSLLPIYCYPCPPCPPYPPHPPYTPCPPEPRCSEPPAQTTQTLQPEAIIPYASGPAGGLQFGTASLTSSGTAVTVGNSVTGIALAGGSIDLNTIGNMAPVVPRNGVITSIAAYFAVSSPITLGNTLTIHAQLYASATPNEIFTPLGTAVTLSPSFGALVTAGSCAYTVDTSQELQVNAGTRLLLVFYAAASTPFETPTVINGYCSGGLSIR